MKIVVTGTTGYIGARLAKLGMTRGHVIVAASRRLPVEPFDLWIPFDFTSPIDIPSDVDAVVHLAINTQSANSTDEDNEILVACNLMDATKKVGARFIFVSSQTARSDAPTAYGRTKWRIEQEVLAVGGWVVRPGQVYGGELRGLFGTLVKVVRKLPVLPYFVPAPKVQPIHVDDLSEGLLRIAERADLPSGIYCLASYDAIRFSTFLVEIAKTRLRCWRGFIPVPVAVIGAVALGLGKSLSGRLGLERLRSLFDLPYMATASDLERLGLKLRSLRAGMHPSGNDRRRCLLREGQALLIYVLKTKASGALLRRYVRAVEKLRDGRDLGLPQLFLQWPVMLAIVDNGSNSKTVWGNELLWRLDSATILAEATPQGAQRFLGLGDRHGFTRSLLRMARAMLLELGWRLIGLLLLPVIRMQLRAKNGRTR